MGSAALRADDASASLWRPEEARPRALDDLRAERPGIGRTAVVLRDRLLKPRKHGGHRPDAFMGVKVVHFVAEVGIDATIDEPTHPDVDGVA